MNKIEKLIKEMCPNGVEYRRIRDICKINRGVRVTKNKLIPFDIHDKKLYPVISGGMKPMGYINQYNENENTITIVKYGSAGFVSLQKEKFWANDVCYCLKPEGKLINKFLFYLLKNKQIEIYSLVEKDAIPNHLPIENLNNILVPLPPTEIQNEIVKILDNFTQLEAELEARVKQYQYYRNKLLDFDNNQKLLANYLKKIINKEIDNQISNESLGKLVIYENGKGHESFVDDNGKYKLINSKFISSQGLTYKKTNKILTNAKKDDITMVLSDLPNGKALGKCYIVEEEGIYAVNQRICKLSVLNKNKINPKFLFYVLNRNKKILDYDNKIDQTNLNKEQVLNLIIPVPSLEVQTKIVNILDKLQDYSKDIKTGLPLEIEQRQKQYQYYRNLLLDFKANAQGGH